MWVGLSDADTRVIPLPIMGRGRKPPVRDLHGLPPVLARHGSLELRLATSRKDIRRAQRLRYRIFFQEGAAAADRRSALLRRDICAFDRICDHLIVIDHAARGKFGKIKPKVVGCYRLLRQEAAEEAGGFYSAQEYDIAPLLARHNGKRFLELGRSCVHHDYRGKKTVELLWEGIWIYARHHRIDVMIGCASFEGTDMGRLGPQLSFLAQHAAAEPDWNARARDHRFVSMAGRGETVDPRRALAALPPLVKAYLRLGAQFGEGAVIDHQFGTTDVFVVLPVERIDPRYIQYFSGAQKAAA